MIKSLGLALAFSCVVVVAAPAAEAKTPPALGWHFAGMKALRESGPETTLKEIGKLPKSGLLAGQIRSRLTQHLPGWFDLNTSQLSAEVVAPLVADLLEHESAARFEGEQFAAGDWVFAVNLGAANTGRWKESLLIVGRRLGLGEPEPLKLSALSGWQIPAKGTGNGFAFVTHGDWALVARSFKQGSAASGWAEALAKNGRPVPKAGEAWLQVDVRPAAAGWHPSLPFAGKLAHISAAFSWQGGDVRTTAKLTVNEPVKPADSAWQIPKGLALDPLISFTAVRNLQKFFSELDPVKGLNASLIPDQWFGWSRGSVAFIDDFAVPVTDAEPVFAHLQRSVPATYNARLLELALGQWLVATNASRLLWRGLPVFVPYIGPKQDGQQAFLYGGIFPLTEQTNATPAPAELFAQFESRKDLVYYDWEIAAARIAAYEQASRFTALFLPAAKAQEATHAAAWLTEIQPMLGNVVTEITSPGPTELAVTRRSQAGMTGIELWLLTHWLDSAEFPKFPYDPPRKPVTGVRPTGLPGQP